MDASPGAPPLVIRLFEQHGPAVYRYFRRLTVDAGAAEDLSQEVFLRIVRHGARYEPRERERAWKYLTVHSGETVEIEVPEVEADLPGIGSLAGIFQGQRTAIRLTARRLR